MRVAFSLDSGEQLRGNLTDKQNRQLIVVCHGYQSNGRTPTIRSLCRGLNRHGYSTFAFDFPPSSGVDIERHVEALAGIIDHFTPQYDGFILLAASLGAVSATIAAIKLPKVSGLITINGFFAMGRLGKQHRRIFRNFRFLSFVIPRYKRIWHYYKRELQPDKLRVPVLVLHANDDRVVYKEQSRNFYAKVAAPKTFEELQTADHGLESADDIAMAVTAVAKWLSSRRTSGGRKTA